jgi:hypothetical protein
MGMVGPRGLLRLTHPTSDDWNDIMMCFLPCYLGFNVRGEFEV